MQWLFCDSSYFMYVVGDPVSSKADKQSSETSTSMSGTLKVGYDLQFISRQLLASALELAWWWYLSERYCISCPSMFWRCWSSNWKACKISTQMARHGSLTRMHDHSLDERDAVKQWRILWSKIFCGYVARAETENFCMIAEYCSLSQAFIV